MYFSPSDSEISNQSTSSMLDDSDQDHYSDQDPDSDSDQDPDSDSDQDPDSDSDQDLYENMEESGSSLVPVTHPDVLFDSSFDIGEEGDTYNMMELSGLSDIQQVLDKVDIHTAYFLIFTFM